VKGQVHLFTRENAAFTQGAVTGNAEQTQPAPRFGYESRRQEKSHQKDDRRLVAPGGNGKDSAEE
jgi:hypothetical protein